ncbi:MAG: cytochrome c biogenesis heme-transporting ATPase CcmA [Gammaproteobacteria bacterium]|nr:cytochrome c biogenesis heme-transporting ATPase CcmA [Gammaproteobacteria bacterium]
MEESRDLEILKVSQLFCERDERILFKGLAFSVREGQILQIKGSNGSGKTTLLRILCGLNSGYQGLISWRGKPIGECLDEFYSSLTYIGHRVGVSKVLTPIENLRWVSGLHHQVTDQAIYSSLQKMGLKGFEESQCFSLSAGQQQRVSLSKLPLSRSKLWILDEPFTTLDADGIELLEILLCEHVGRGGLALVTTHHQLAIPGLTILDLG